MSKSDTDSRSLIQLTDSPDQIREKLKKSVTDFKSEITYDPAERPAIANLLMLYRAVLDVSLEKVLEETSKINKVELKARLAEAVIELLRPVHGKMKELRNDMGYLEQVMAQGTDRARTLASQTMDEVESLAGFRPAKAKLSNAVNRQLYSSPTDKESKARSS